VADQVICALSELFHRWMTYQQQCGRLVTCPADESRSSPCCGYSETPLQWAPVMRDPVGHLNNIAEALECSFHPAIHAYYGAAFSGPMTFSFKGLKVSLVQPWNEDDFVRLQENLVAHVLMLKKLKLPITFFLATVPDEQQVISLDNESGQVILEQLGRQQRWVLAEDLPTFLRRLSPLLG